MSRGDSRFLRQRRRWQTEVKKKKKKRKGENSRDFNSIRRVFTNNKINAYYISTKKNWIETLVRICKGIARIYRNMNNKYEKYRKWRIKNRDGYVMTE